METSGITGIESAPLLEYDLGLIPSLNFSRRLLIGTSDPEAFDPNKDQPLATKESLGSFDKRNYSIFNTKSTEERKKYWESQSEKTFEEKKEIWMNKMEEIFKASQGFFTNTEQGKKWSLFLKRINIDTQLIDKAQLESFYDKYLKSDNLSDEGIKLFVKDIISSYRSSGKVNYKDIQQNLDAIEWISKVFGEKSSQIISRLTSTETQLEANANTLVTEKKDKLTDIEIELLEFLSGKKYTGSETYSEKDKTNNDKTDDISDQEDESVLKEEKTKPESELIEKRVQDQERYVERIKSRYTVKNLEEKIKIARTGKDSKDQKVENNQHRKDFQEARRLQNFLNCLNPTPKDYVQELEEINSTLPPMGEQTKFSIVIPSYGEASRIKPALESWTNQKDASNKPISPETIEILVLINRPNESRKFDNTKEVIDQFKIDHPEFAASIHAVEKTFNFPMVKNKQPDGTEIETPDVKMGLIYRFATDLSVIRNLNRQGKNKERIANHLIRTGGADVVGRNPQHVNRIISSFDQNPNLEQYVSLSDYDPKIYKKLPLLFLVKSLQDEMNENLTQGLSHIGLGTYRASTYTKAGGFDDRAKIAEEIELSRRMRKVIELEGHDIKIARKRDLVLNALDDPRRDIASIFIGKPITKAYDDYNIDEAVRKINLQDILDDPVPPQAQLTPEHFDKQADAIFKFYMDQFYNPDNNLAEPNSTELTIKYFKDSLSKLGILSENVIIYYDGKPYEKSVYELDIYGSTAPISTIREKFSVHIGALPPPAELEKLIEEKYKKRGGNWAVTGL